MRPSLSNAVTLLNAVSKVKGFALALCEWSRRPLARVQLFGVLLCTKAQEASTITGGVAAEESVSGISVVSVVSGAFRDSVESQTRIPGRTNFRLRPQSLQWRDTSCLPDGQEARSERHESQHERDAA